MWQPFFSYLCTLKIKLSMKKLFFLFFLAMSVMTQAQTITIGEGSGMTAQVPYNSFYNYSFTEQLLVTSLPSASTLAKAIMQRRPIR